MQTTETHNHRDRAAELESAVGLSRPRGPKIIDWRAHPVLHLLLLGIHEIGVCARLMRAMRPPDPISFPWKRKSVVQPNVRRPAQPLGVP